MNLYMIEDGIRSASGDSDDRDLFVVATSPDDAVLLWQRHYGEDVFSPETVRLIAVPVEGPARVLNWATDCPVVAA